MAVKRAIYLAKMIFLNDELHIISKLMNLEIAERYIRSK